MNVSFFTFQTKTARQINKSLFAKRKGGGGKYIRYDNFEADPRE